MAEHRWSGWPGAWCLDCGAEDPREVALASGEDCEEVFDDKGNLIELKVRFDPSLLECPEPGSDNHNPYIRKEK